LNFGDHNDYEQDPCNNDPPDIDDFEDNPPLPPPFPPSQGGPPPTSTYPEYQGFTYQKQKPGQYYPDEYGQPSRYHHPCFIPLHPDLVVEKYAALKKTGSMSRLAVKLARESFFGEEIMEKCTPQGKDEQTNGLHGLPKTELYNLKLYLVQLFPSLSKSDFEGYWKLCITSIGQACKGIRTKQKNKR